MRHKGYTWVLPHSAFKRAIEISSSEWTKIFVLSPLDVLVLKLERFNEKDQKDIIKILKKLKPSIKEIMNITEEYLNLLRGKAYFKDEIKCNLQVVIVEAKYMGCKD